MFNTFNRDALVVYHSKDIDGITSGYLLSELLKKCKIVPELIGYDYADPIPERILNYDGPAIYMADVTLPIDEMIKISQTKGLVLLDHHETFYLKYLERKDEFSPMFKYYYDINKSAAEICYEFAINFYPLMDNIYLHQVVKLVSDYDIFKSAYIDTNFWENQVLPFQYGIRAETGNDIYKFPDFVNLDTNDLSYNFNKIISNGEAVLKYIEGENAILSKAYSFERTPKQGVFKGLRLLCLNKSNGSLLVVKDVYDVEKHDLALFFSFNGEKYNCSIRTKSEKIHLGLLAQELGGGGHKKASGFSVKTLDEIFL